MNRLQGKTAFITGAARRRKLGLDIGIEDGTSKMTPDRAGAQQKAPSTACMLGARKRSVP
ncbi:hypothetical protein K7H91_20685 [Martelella mediterranea]|uniref:hypothetical protein n=1 Tax=Martelella mediterranea TaxID=293089 RepID=UPI001E320F09|nr:hypothetical protein [Martelella mediterranea]MCD1636182.1 hypothetical protein [Martelella mediterranea]